jgi:hypothetical protein
LYPIREDGGRAAARVFRFSPPSRRWKQYSRRQLLDLAGAHDVRRPGLSHWPRDLLLKVLREEGVIGHVRIVRGT